MVNYPGMVDYPNHLVRCYILAHRHVDPVLAQRYVVLEQPIPNLAIESVVVPLNHLIPILVAGKIFLSLSALLFIAGCVALGYAITGKRSWMALPAAFTFYHSNLFYGFVNYVFGLGVFLLIFALWLRVRERMRWGYFALLCGLSLVAFLAHLSSIAFLAVSCVTVAVMDFMADRKPVMFVRRLVWLGCPAVLMLGFMKKSGTVGTIEWSTLSQKVIHLFAPIRSYSVAMDVLVLCVSVVALAVLLRSGKLHRTAVVGVVLFVLFLVTPHVLFTSSAADVRYMMPALLVALLSLEPSWGRREVVVYGLLFGCLVARSAEIDYYWHIIDQREARVLHMGDAMPRNALVLGAFTSNESLSAKLDRGFPHILTLWIVQHDALVSTLFTYPGQQPILDRVTLCKDPKEESCVKQYDYVWTSTPNAERDAILARLAQPEDTFADTTLWRVRH